MGQSKERRHQAAPASSSGGSAYCIGQKLAGKDVEIYVPRGFKDERMQRVMTFVWEKESLAVVKKCAGRVLSSS